MKSIWYSGHYYYSRRSIELHWISDYKHIIIITTQPDIITIQETKLTTTSETPKITNYTPIRTDRVVLGGGLLTYIIHNITKYIYPNAFLTLEFPVKIHFYMVAMVIK